MSQLQTFKISDKPELLFDQIDSRHNVLIDIGSEYNHTSIASLKQYLNIPSCYGQSFNEILYENPTKPTIQHGILDCQFYNADEISFGYPKPGFLRSNISSNILNIFANSNDPLRLFFSLGLHSGGNNHGLWNGIIKQLDQNKNITVTETSYIYAEIDNSADDNIKFGTLPYFNNICYYQVEEPSSKQNNTHWFDIKTNWMKIWNNNLNKWIIKIRIILGLIGCGNDGNIYTIKSYIPNKGISDSYELMWPNYQNPWAHYDGVSFVTDGYFVAQQASYWVNDHVVCQAVANNPLALQAVSENPTAVNLINNSSVASQYFDFT